MKNFKEFSKDFNAEILHATTDIAFAYAAYCQGYAEGKSEIAVFYDGEGHYIPLAPNLPLPKELTTPTFQLKGEYTPEELKEIQKAAEDINKYLAEQREKENAEL